MHQSHGQLATPHESEGLSNHVSTIELDPVMKVGVGEPGATCLVSVVDVAFRFRGEPSGSVRTKENHARVHQ